MPDAFTRLALKGEPYSIGYQHGKRLASAIADNVDIYLSLFRHYAGLDRQAVSEGEAVDIDKTPTGMDSLYETTEGADAYKPFRIAAGGRLPRPLLPGSIIRYCRAGKLLGRAACEIEVSTRQSILRDHVNRPSSTCRRADQREYELEQLQTNAS